MRSYHKPVTPGEDPDDTNSDKASHQDIQRSDDKKRNGDLKERPRIVVLQVDSADLHCGVVSLNAR